MNKEEIRTQMKGSPKMKRLLDYLMMDHDGMYVYWHLFTNIGEEGRRFIIV